MTKLVLLSAVTVLLMLSGCANGGSSGTATEPPELDGATIESPIYDALGIRLTFDESGASDEARALAEAAVAEEAIAVCMANEGFDYTPVIPAAEDLGPPVPADLELYGREFIETYGLGVSTLAFAQDFVGPDLVGHEGSATIEDPNFEYLQTLSAAGQSEYQEALYGDELSIDPNVSSEEAGAQLEAWEPGGCVAVGQEAVVEDSLLISFFDEFSEQLVELESRIASDPEVVSYWKEKSECVSAAGFDFLSLNDFEEALSSEVAQIAAAPQRDPFEGMDAAEIAALSPDEVRELTDVADGLRESDAVRLAEIQAREIDTMVAVDDCEASPRYYEAFLSPIRARYESEFVEEYGDQIETFRAGHS